MVRRKLFGLIIPDCRRICTAALRTVFYVFSHSLYSKTFNFIAHWFLAEGSYSQLIFLETRIFDVSCIFIAKSK